MFLDIIKVCVSHVFFPYCLRSLVLILSSRNIEKAGDSQKRYGLKQTKIELVIMERKGSADDCCLMYVNLIAVFSR